MHLTLMRHGHAHPWAGDDAARELTTRGREAVAAVLDALFERGWKPGAIVCSPLLRSRQSAELLRRRLPDAALHVLRGVVSTTSDLLPEMASLGLVDPIVVGHQPGLSRLTGELLSASALPFRPATAAWFEVDALPPRSPGRLLHHLDAFASS